MTHKLIAVSDENYENLRSLGEMGDSFDDVITELLKKNKNKAVDERQSKKIAMEGLTQSV